MTDHFDALATALQVGAVTGPADASRPERMNANALCVRHRVFAMRVGEDLVLKLPARRVTELIDAGIAGPNLVGGRPMKEWVNLPPTRAGQWVELARESLDYVRGKR